MFSKKTVFVVGAGGSQDFGLPLGAKLKDQIADALYLEIEDGTGNISRGSRNIYKAIHRLIIDNKSLEFNDLFMAGRAISNGMSQAISIDNFLQTHFDNENIVLMGKLGIAHAIIQSEINSSLNHFEIPRHGNRIDFTKIQDTWLSAFLKILLEGVPRGDDALFDNVSIITFNYDRCIERYISAAIENQWLCSSSDAQSYARNLNIIHIYGSIGRLPWQENVSPPIEFGADLSGLNLSDCAKNLHTFGETTQIGGAESELEKMLDESEVVVFIGFSFMKINMRYFVVPTGKKRRKILATSKGISHPNLEVINAELGTLLGPENDVIFVDKKGAGLIEDYSRLLSR